MKKLSCTFWLFFLSASFSFAQQDTAVIKTNVEVPDMLVQKILGEWDRLLGAGPNLTSRLCTRAASDDLAQLVSCFDTCYKDTSLFGVYSECTKENIPRLMEVVVEVRAESTDHV